MIKAPLPPDEKARLAALRRLQILDTPAEGRFDRIARIAQRVFKVPTVLVSLVEAKRQWFKSCQGLDASETPRDHSFCAHAILGEDVMVVPDAKLDPRFHDNPLVAGPPFIRFYAGSPLKMAGGLKAGTLCLIDRKPRSLRPADLALLSNLASLVEDELNADQLNLALAQVRDREAELKDFLENAADLIQLSSTSGKIQFANRAWRQWLNYDDRDLKTLGVLDVVAPGQRAKVKKHFAKARLGETVHALRTVLIAKNGAEVPVEATVNCRFKNRVPQGMRAVFRDISQRLKAEEMKNEVVALASHELRGPLQSILSSLELLKEGGAGAPAEARALVGGALGSTNFMLAILNDYLDLHKIEAGHPGGRPAAVDLVAAAQKILDAARAQGARGKLRFRLVASLKRAPVRADPQRLAQVLVNLISNAVKYSPAGGLIQVMIGSSARAVRVTVADEGPGIPPAFRDKVFTKFAASGAPGQKKGTGLGLCLCKALVENMGGTIGLDARAERGGAFFFELPLRAGKSHAG